MLAFQRINDRVSFVDGGLYQEDHGDHLHDYAIAPSLLSYSLSGVRPTHFESHDGQSALFFDGLADPYATASVALLSDASIAANRYLACQHPDHPHHGGGQFLVCDGCGHVDETELAAPALAAVQAMASSHHFHLSSQPLEIHGLCAHCQQQHSAPDSQAN